MQKYLYKGNTKSGIVFQNIQNEVIHLNYYLKSYRQIFDEEHSDVIQKISPQFFNNLHKMYLESMILCISRLFDRSQKKLKNGEIQKYLSFKHLLDCLVDDQIPSEELSDIRSEIDTIEKEISPTLIKYRNKFIGHIDTDLVIFPNEFIEQIKCFLLVDTEEAIKKINKLTNSITKLFVFEIHKRDFTIEIIQDYEIHFESINSDTNKFIDSLIKVL